jgi:hypothetical protein
MKNKITFGNLKNIYYLCKTFNERAWSGKNGQGKNVVTLVPLTH